MMPQTNKIHFFDGDFKPEEQIPRRFTMTFQELEREDKKVVRVVFNNSKQVGDIISDNSHVNDFYRYHDIFHFSFAALLGWSPCTRAMLKRKRKSSELLDEIEDGARAAITEEAISMIIFNEAKRKNYFENTNKVSRTTLRIIKEMTANLEVRLRSVKEWESAILKAYAIFRFLIQNNGGTVKFDSFRKTISM